MHNGRPLVVAFVLFAAVVGSAGARPAEWPGDVSWADDRHAWVSGQHVRCSPAAALCATSDGGRTWRGVFDARTLSGYYRASRAAGVAWANVRQGWPRAFWTRDGGRRWYESRALAGGGVAAAAASDRLWVSTEFPAGVAEIRPFPPRGTAVCRGRWVSSLGGEARLAKSICAGAFVEAGMRRRVVTRVDAHYVRQLIAVRGGIVGLASSLRAEGSFVVFSWVSRRAEQTRLSVRPDHFLGSYPVLAVSWPSIFVAVDVIDNPLDDKDAGSGHVVFESTDGGRTWTRH